MSRYKLLEARVAAMEHEKAELAAARKRDRERMERLHEDMLKATETLRRNGAELVADLDDLKADVARLKGADEETSYRLEKLQEDVDMVKEVLDRRLGISMAKLPKGVKQEPGELLAQGKRYLDKGDTRTARGLFQKLLDLFPDDKTAPRALFLVGETYFAEGRYKQAIREYQRVHDRYRKNKQAPVGKALLRISEALLKQGDCNKARGVLKYVIEYDRKSTEAKEAKKRLKKLGRKCKGG